MRTRLKILYLLSIASLAACATHSAPDHQQAELSKTTVLPTENSINIVINTKEAAYNSAGEKLICKEYNLTGSRLKTVKSCHTKAQWDAIKNETQRNIQDMYIKKGSDHG